MQTQLESVARRRCGGQRMVANLVFCLVLVQACLVQAELVNCSTSSNSGLIYQVYVDDPSIKESLRDDPQLGQIMERLSFNLDKNIQAMTLNNAKVPLSFSFCDKRNPKTSSAFTEPVIDLLDDDLVILEVWGQIEAAEDQGVISDRSVTVGYVLIPVLLELMPTNRTVGLQFVKYASDGTADEEIIDLLEQSAELKAFVSVGLGVNLMVEKKYDDAMGYLCTALTLLEEDQINTGSTGREDLTEYIKTKTRKIIADATVVGSGFEHGGLSMLDPDNPCGR